MESTNWRSLGKKIGKGLVNAVTGHVISGLWQGRRNAFKHAWAQLVGPATTYCTKNK